MRKAEAAKADHFARHMVPGAHTVDETVGHVLLKRPKPIGNAISLCRSARWTAKIPFAALV
jgi:hypothetical protein